MKHACNLIATQASEAKRGREEMASNKHEMDAWNARTQRHNKHNHLTSLVYQIKNLNGNSLIDAS